MAYNRFMVNLEGIERVSKGHGSFAVWREGKIDDVSVIKECNKDLHGRVIFVGYNASGIVPPFKNFHSIHRGGRDSWLAESIGKHPTLRGAYMTDFYKGDFAVRETGVNTTDEAIQRNLPILRAEVALFEMQKPRLVAFGDKTFKLLTRLGFTPEYVPHYARQGLKREEFISAVMELGEKIARTQLPSCPSRG